MADEQNSFMLIREPMIDSGMKNFNTATCAIMSFLNDLSFAGRVPD